LEPWHGHATTAQAVPAFNQKQQKGASPSSTAVPLVARAVPSSLVVGLF